MNMKDYIEKQKELIHTLDWLYSTLMFFCLGAALGAMWANSFWFKLLVGFIGFIVVVLLIMRAVNTSNLDKIEEITKGEEKS